MSACEQWQLEDIKFLFDNQHPDFAEAETVLKTLPEDRMQWQNVLKDVEQIAAVTKCNQSSLKDIVNDISRNRNTAALIVACAILSEIVVHQSQYRNSGALLATIKAGLKQAATMSLSIGDLPTKLRSFVEGLNKEPASSQVQSATPPQTSPQKSQIQNGQKAVIEDKEEQKGTEKKSKKDKKKKESKKASKQEDYEAEMIWQ